ncbi:MAG: ribose 5-phosphate isomerase B [Pirellulales bacterium]
MRIAIGSDHRGVALKSRLAGYLASLGHEVTDFGAHQGDAVDYPDIASCVGQAVAGGKAERGVLICGTGIGMAITANKLPGVRATTCSDEATAEICRRHNDVNVLCLAGSPEDPTRVERILAVWLETPFEGGRHARRLEKIAELERGGANGRDCR